MKKILYVQPIFLPNEEIFDKNIQSIISFRKLCNYITDNIMIDIRLGGWSINDEFWEKFILKVNNLYFKQNINIKRYDKNYGKAYVINSLTKDISNYDYLLTSDSDIIFDERKDFFDRILTVVKESENILKKPFGLMALNQKISNCHLIDYLSENIFEINGYNNYKEKIMFNSIPSGIAGGCLLISSDNWLKSNGYREMGVYAGDDALFLQDTSNNGFSFFLCESIGVIHPPENNLEYQKWKVMVCQRDSHGGSNGIDDIKINESQNIWKK